MKFLELVLNNHSRMKLLSHIGGDIPSDWDVIAHHMTICFNSKAPSNLIGQLGKLKTVKVTHIGKGDGVIAVAVEGLYSSNEIPHITIATSPNTKPEESNNITNWVKLKTPFNVSGIIQTPELTN
jgi:hypothetical protein